jgi:tetratricopeptide (TPR) repeat protein
MRMVVIGVLLLGLAPSPAHAQLMPPRRPVDPGSPQSVTLTSQSGEALVHDRAADALALADKAIAADARNPWAHYDRGAALTDLGRVDDAVAAFKTAERSFSAADAWGRSIAVYGQANVLSQAGRCSEARPAFEQYAVLVERSDPGSARMARSYANNCLAR